MKKGLKIFEQILEIPAIVAGHNIISKRIISIAGMYFREKLRKVCLEGNVQANKFR